MVLWLYAQASLVLLPLTGRRRVGGAERRLSLTTASAALKSGDGVVLGEPAVGDVAEAHKRRDDPEWHSLRLFGGGRHSGAFQSGAERNTAF